MSEESLDGKKKRGRENVKQKGGEQKEAAFDYVLRNFLQELLSIKSFVPYRSIRSPIPFNLIRLTIFQVRIYEVLNTWKWRLPAFSNNFFHLSLPNRELATRRKNKSRERNCWRGEKKYIHLICRFAVLNEFASKSINLSAMNTFRPRIFSLGNFFLQLSTLEEKWQKSY